MRIPGDYVLLYGGSLESGRYIVEVMNALRDHPFCILKVAGVGRLADYAIAMHRKCKNIIYLGWVGTERMEDLLLSSDVVLCLFDVSNENNVIGTPNRLFEAMAYGLPVIASEGTASGKIVKETECGLVMSWSEENFLACIERLRDVELRKRLGLNGRKAVEETYNWKTMSERLINAYGRLWT